MLLTTPSADWLRTFVAAIARGVEGWIELRTVAGASTLQRWLAVQVGPDEIVKAARDLAARNCGDVCIGMTVRGRHRGSADACIRAGVLWGDYDSGLELLETYPIPPTWLIASRTPGRFHSYWRLDKPVDLTDPAQRHLFGSRIKRLQIDTGSDQVADLPRVMRIPSLWRAK